MSPVLLAPTSRAPTAWLCCCERPQPAALAPPGGLAADGSAFWDELPVAPPDDGSRDGPLEGPLAPGAANGLSDGAMGTVYEVIY